jgi:hypothetical protein
MERFVSWERFMGAANRALFNRSGSIDSKPDKHRLWVSAPFERREGTKKTTILAAALIGVATHALAQAIDDASSKMSAS